MTEVRKWYIGVYGGEAQARPCSPAEFEIINEREGRYFVLKEDYDSAAQCFLTAAEGCVAAERRERALQQRLTAADERADVLEKALRRIARPHDCGCLPCRGDCTSELVLEITVEEMRETALAALKPAEGGGDDS